MKKILIACCLAACLQSYAQDTAKVEQYCELIASNRFMSSKVTIDINYGEERSAWKDHRIKDDNGKLQKFNSAVDALNYLGKAGWKLVNVSPIIEGGQMVYHYFFKKEFSQAETAEQ